MNTKICLTGLLLALGLSADAALYQFGTLNGDSAIGIIPDNNTIGLTDAHTLSGLSWDTTSVILTLSLQSGYSGDLAGYLRLGDLTTSPYYDLTSAVQAQTLSGPSATTFTVDVTSAFSSQNPNGTWTLFFSDNSAGAQTTLNGWSLDVTAVPEPVNVALALFAAGLVGVGAVRRYRNSSKSTR
ncbi:MAG TPA: proprotein convertase P-domain-containing protein [bacterium]|nr:proprotein convertase P-domain-containing protein [bacterium]